MTAAAAAMACAAMRLATLIRSIVSASLTSGASSRTGAGLSTYSGRAIDAGTGRRGDTTPGATLAYVIGIRWSLGTSADPSTWRAPHGLLVQPHHRSGRDRREQEPGRRPDGALRL